MTFKIYGFFYYSYYAANIPVITGLKGCLLSRRCVFFVLSPSSFVLWGGAGRQVQVIHLIGLLSATWLLSILH